MSLSSFSSRKNCRWIATVRNGSQPFAKLVRRGRPVFGTPCFSRRIANAMTDEETIEDVPGVEQLDEPTEGSKPFTRIHYPDTAEELIEEARSLPHREKHFIAPRVGWPKRIYRRAEAK